MSLLRPRREGILLFTGWELEVIGVKSPAVWDRIVAGKSLATVRALQAADPAGNNITADISTNTYLFFNVRP